MPVGLGGNPFQTPFYDPGSLYGAPYSYATAPVVGGPAGFLAQNPQAAWTRHTAGWAAPFSPYGDWLQNRAYGQAYRGFQAAQATNPDLRFHDQYLPTLSADFFQNLWLRQDPTIRGINAPRYGGGRMQWFGG